MRLVPMPAAAAAGLLLALTASAFGRAAAAAVPAPGRVLVQDRFLDDASRAALLCRTDAQGPADPCSCRSHVPVPGWFSNALLSVVRRGAEEAAAAAGAPRLRPAVDAEVLLPVYEAVGDQPEHQDRHVSGADEGALAGGNVAVVYLEGDGDFVLTDKATGVEHRVPIVPGKLISWPNAGFLHRVENASPRLRRRMLGPMALDAASRGLVGVGSPKPCTILTNNKCINPALPITPDYTEIPDGGFCMSKCTDASKGYSAFDGTGNCYCSTQTCTLFTQATGWVYWVNTEIGNPEPDCPTLVLGTSQPTVSPTVTPPTDSITIAAGSSSAGQTSVPRGGLYALRVTLTVPAAGGRRILELDQEQAEQRELRGFGHKPLNTTDYALLVTVPANNQVTYRRSSVSPALKPASLKKAVKQANGDLLWARVPMPLYRSKASTRTFKVVFKVNQGATSPLVFGASVWKNNVKLGDSAPITVPLANGK